MLGVCGCGALISSLSPASSTALEVLFPNAPITVPFCLYLGRLSKRLFTPLGVKQQITSNSFFSRTSRTSVLCVRYMNARTNSQLLVLSQFTISLSCWFSEHT